VTKLLYKQCDIVRDKRKVKAVKIGIGCVFNEIHGLKA